MKIAISPAQKEGRASCVRRLTRETINNSANTRSAAHSRIHFTSQAPLFLQLAAAAVTAVSLPATASTPSHSDDAAAATAGGQRTRADGPARRLPGGRAAAAAPEGQRRGCSSRQRGRVQRVQRGACSRLHAAAAVALSSIKAQVHQEQHDSLQRYLARRPARQRARHCTLTVEAWRIGGLSD